MNKIINIINFKYPFLFIAIITFHSNISAEEGLFFNPGIKIGYNFGKHNGFVLGAEMSTGITFWKGDIDYWRFTGFVVGYSHCFSNEFRNYTYVEFEGGDVYLGGGSIGLLVNIDKSNINPYFRLFIGQIGYLSFRYPIGELPIEFSLVGKLPIMTSPTPALD
jgi:hypothetical protein